MAAINKIEAYLYTANVESAGTDGWVYLASPAASSPWTPATTTSSRDRPSPTCSVRAPTSWSPTTTIRASPSWTPTTWTGTRPTSASSPRQVPGLVPGARHRQPGQPRHARPPHRFDNPRLVGSADNQRIWLDQKYGKVLYLKRYDG